MKSAKTCLFTGNRDTTYAGFLRCSSSNGPNSNIKVVLNKESQILYSNNQNELVNIRTNTKLLPKRSLNISILSNNESFGFSECALGCSYSLITVKCHSREGVIYKLDKNEFFRRVKQSSPPMLKLVKHKLDFLARRIISLNGITGIKIPQNYYDIEAEISFESIVSNNKNSDSELEQHCEEEKTGVSIFAIFDCKFI